MVEKALEVCYSLFKNIDFPAETGRLLGVVESSKGCQETELLSHGRPRGFLAKFPFALIVPCLTPLQLSCLYVL